MKRIFALSVAALLFAGSAIAQKADKQAAKDKAGKEWKKEGKEARHAKHGKHHGAEIAKELNLTEAQKQEMKAVNKDYKEKAQALKQERKAKAENILTAEQKAKLAQRKDKKSAEMKARGAGRFEAVSKDLNLSEAQGQKMKALNEDFRTKAKAIKDNASLSQEQKKEQLKALHDQRKTAMESVLTAEQRQKLEAKKGKRDGK